ncbi:MAG: hypothetical protein AABX02_01590 [archaeon]
MKNGLFLWFQKSGKDEYLFIAWIVNGCMTPSQPKTPARRKIGRRTLLGGFVLAAATAGLFASRPPKGISSLLHTQPQNVLMQIARANGFPKESILAFMRMNGTLGARSIDHLRKIGFERKVGEKEFPKFLVSARGLAIGFWYLLEDSRSTLERATTISYFAPINGLLKNIPFSQLSDDSQSRVIIYTVLNYGLPVRGERGDVPLEKLLDGRRVVDYGKIKMDPGVANFLKQMNAIRSLSMKKQADEIEKLDFEIVK